MSERYVLDKDLKEAVALADSLTPYVHENQLYGIAGSGGFFSKMPAMTIGGLVMRLRRLDALRDQLTPAQQEKLEQAKARNAEVQKEWRVHYEGKMLREANSRLDAMRMYFDECASSPRTCANNYGPEVLRRTTVQELVIAMEEMGIESEDLRTKLAGTDSKLRRVVRPAEFVWAEMLKPAYPEKPFWWLYQHPPAPTK